MTDKYRSTYSVPGADAQLKTRDAAVSFGAAYEGDDCLKWPFYIGDKGYGHTRYKGVRMLASRAVCLIKHGEPTFEGAQAAHSCHNTSCFNGNHIRWKTNSENSAEKVAAGRQAKGERAGRVKLSEAAIVEMRRLWGPLTTRELGAMFGVSHAVAYKIVARQTWTHVL